MQALFNIRGRMIVCETDSSLPADTVKVHSLDSFAKILQEIDVQDFPQVDVPTAVGKNGKVVVVRTRDYKKERQARAEKREAQRRLKASIPPSDPNMVPPLKANAGHKGRVILGNYGVTREEIAQAINEKSSLITDQQLRLLAYRYGIGNVNAVPHNTIDTAKEFYPTLVGITGQARVSAEVRIALKRLGFRLHKRKRNGKH